MQTVNEFTEYEVAYRIPGQAWKRRRISSRAAEDRFYDMVGDEGGEVRWSDETVTN